MEYVQNQYDMVIKVLVLKVSMEHFHYQIEQEVHSIQMVQNVDQKFF